MKCHMSKSLEPKVDGRRNRLFHTIGRVKAIKERVRAEADMFVLYLRTANKPNGKNNKIVDPRKNITEITKQILCN